VEKFNYVAVIFELRHLAPAPRSHASLTQQLDGYFIDRLCRLNVDPDFTAGLPQFQGLYEHLVKYAVMYFDAETTHFLNHPDYIQDFINRHRVYVPPPKVRMKIREAERLFGHPWKELQAMSRSALTRCYRQRALKYHPDHGGEEDVFRRLTTYYKALLAKK
jgi:hypothetical protein